MNCQRALEQIDIILDDGENPGADLYAHLSTCAECRRKFDSYKRIENKLRSAAVRPVVRETPAAGLKVIERRTWRIRTLGLVAAACVMLACAIAAYVAHSQPSPQKIVKNETPIVLPVPKPTEVKVPEKSLADKSPAPAPAPTLEKILSVPQDAFKSEGEKMLSDMRAIESFLLRCLPVASRDNRG